MESYFKSVILGIVQGLTEFLPISSTAHLRIVPALLHWEDPGTAFSAVIQLGTLLSVLIYFRNDLIKICGSFASDLIKNKKLISYESNLGFWILLGTIPICVFGLLFKGPIEQGMVRNLNVISFYLIFFGILLYVSELLAKEHRTISKINILDVLLIGLAQSFALLPGVSRSAVTIASGLILGLKRSDAARFSFLLSIPAVFASGLLEMYTLFSSGLVNESFTGLLLALFSAFVSGYFAIEFLLRFLQTNKTHIFVIYRIILGFVIIYLVSQGLV